MSARRIGVATFVVTGVAAACLFVGFLLGKFSERAPQPAGQAAKREQTADRENVRGNDRGLEPADPSLPRADNYRATWAVIIGVDNYPVGGSDLKKLSYAVNDAREFRNLLRDEFGFADERTLFLSDNDATHEAIRAAFTAWLPQQQPQADDAILIFFAGHGLIDSQTDAGYLAGVDSHSQKLDATCVPVASIKQWLTAFPCKHKALILDSCYSGSLFEKTAVPAAITVAATAASPTTSVAATAGGGPNRSGDTRGPASPLSLTPVGNNLAYYLRQPAFFGMSAGRLQPVADGSAQDAHSIFTSTLLQVLKERADSTHPDHLFTFRHLAAQVEARVATAAGSHQTPNWGQLAPGDGDFVFRPTVKRQTPREVSAERYKQLQVRFAMNLIDQGVNELENGDPTRGFAMLGQAYHAAAEMPELRASTLALIGAYDFSLPTQLSYTGRVSVAAFSPDGRTILTGSPARLWDTATGRLLREFVPNKEGINAVAFSPDGQKVLTGSNDNTARLWDAKTGKPLGEVMQHYDAVRAVAFSPDGEMVLTGSWDKTARLWDAKTGRPLREPFRHESRVRSVAFSTDGQTFLTGNFDNTARLWNAKTGQPLGESLRHEVVVSPIMSLIKDVKAFGSVPHEEASPFQSVDPDGKKSESNSSKTVFVTGVIAAAFSPDGQTVITGSDDYTARLWDAKTGKPLGEPLRHDALLVFAVAYSHDGKTVLTASGNGARLWDAQTGKLLGEPLRHENSFRALALSPDGQTMLTGSDDAAQLWDAKSGKPLGEAIRHENHGVDVVTFSPDGQMVYTAGWDSRLRNVNSGKPIGMRLRHPLDVDAVAFSPDGQIVLTGSQDGTAWLWDAKTGKPVGEPLRIEYLGNVLSATPRNVAFSPDGRTVLTGSNDETARLWDVKTGKPLGEPLRHDGVVPKLAFSPDGQTVLTGSGNVARLWDAKTGKPLGEPLRHESEIGAVAFSPDGQTVFTGSWYAARLWDAKSGKPLGEAMRHDGAVGCLAFSTDGTKVLTGSSDKTARLWDAKTGKPLGEAMRHDSVVHAVQFSPDGERVLTGSWDKTARLWDAKTGKPLGEPLQHNGEVRFLAFSPDGQMVLTGSNDGIARLWDVKTGKPLGRPMRHESEVHGVAFSPDGQTVLTGSYDGTAWLWPVPKGFPDNPGLVATYVAARSCWQEDSFGVLHRMTLEQQLATWDAASELGREWLQYRSDAAARDACLWHKLQAEEFEANKNWFATAFHLKYLVQNDPQDGDLRQRLATAKKMLEGQRQELEGQRQEAARLSEKKPSPPEKAP